MSERKGKFPIVSVAAIAVGAGTVIGGVYLAYQYFVAPGNTILNQYAFIVQDMMKEIKEFGEKNANQNPAVYGLTESQKQIIEQKKLILQAIEPEVQKVLDSRNLPFAEWITEIILGGLVIAGVVYGVLPLIREKIKSSAFKQLTGTAASTDFTTNLCFNVMSNVFAYEGNLNIASAVYNQMQLYYTTYSLPSLNAQMSYYQSIQQSFAFGTWQYAIATQMINSISFEMSAAGLMGSLYSFWIPLI